MALIDIQPSERVLIVGTSGSGKTFLTWNVLVPRYAVRPVVFDPKERLEPPDDTWNILESFHPKAEKQIIRIPEYEERDGPSLWDAQVQNVLRDGNRTLIIDELTLVTNPRMLPKSLARAIRTGRDYKRGSVGVWMLAQRCADLPISCYSESRHKFCFQLTEEGDQETWGRRTARVVGDEIATLSGHDYVYFDSLKKRMVVVLHETEEMVA